MACKTKLYISRDFPIPVTISGTSFTASDIAELVITLTLVSNPTITKSFTKTLGEITIVGSVITLLVQAADITTAGYYSLKIDMTDTGGKFRGITPCPAELKFETQ